MIRVKWINHSQFMYYMLFVLVSSSILLKIFKLALDSFLNASSGNVKNLKSQIYGWKFLVDQLQEISRILIFATMQFWTSLMYLGIPISLRNMTSKAWQGVIGKMEKWI
jgi:hypothetical protein